MNESMRNLMTDPVALQERSRQEEIRNAGALLNVPAAMVEQYLNSGQSLDAFRTAAADFLAANYRPVGVVHPEDFADIRFAGSEQDNVATAAQQGLELKLSGGTQRFRAEHKRDPSQAALDMSRKSLVDIGAECLRFNGVRVQGMSRERIAKLSLAMPSGFDSGLGTLAAFGGGGAFNTSGSFTNLALNASNKSLARGFEEAPTTFQVWATRGPNLRDFRVANIVKFGEASDMEAIPEGMGPNENRFTDDKEVISADRYASRFSVTFQMILADDLGALDTVPLRMGGASKRKLNRLVYGVLTSNPLMSDGYALFDATNHQANDLVTGAAPSTAQLAIMEKGLRMMRGLNSEAFLNLGLKFILVPVALEVGSRQLLQSTGELADNKSSAVIQPFYGRTQVVSDPELDANSAVKWYGVADGTQVDNVQYRYLDGQETPVQSSWWDPEKAVRHVLVEQCFGVAAAEYRSMIRNAGTGG